MLAPLQDLPIYSDDIWDYLIDMRHYMPSRQDRDSLLKEAAIDIEKQKRVQLWDYFFRIRPDDVGKPQRDEIKKLQKAISVSKAEHDKALQDFERARRDLETQTGGIEQRAIQKLTSASKRNKSLGIITMLSASPFILWPICSVILATANYIGSDVNSSFEAGSFVNFLCCYPIGLPLAGVGISFLMKSALPSKNKIKDEVNAMLNQTQRSNDPRIQNLAIRTQDDPHFSSYEERISLLERQIRHLVDQIPTPPADEQVEIWWQEDIKTITELAVARSGLQGRLVSLLNAPNPFCAYSPTELQDEKSVKDIFLTKSHWETASDRFKHFHAKYFTLMKDGMFANFHGITSIRFLLFAEEVWATYETVFNFITGKQSGEKTSRFDYVNVVSIETLKIVRTIQNNDGENIDIDNIPSLNVRLTNQEQVTITFPDIGYFRQFEGGRNFNENKWIYNPMRAAENAVSNFKEKVNIAHRKREIGKQAE